MKLSVVIPCYNEQGTIAEIIERVKAVPLNTEIIVVDDCSTDGTRELLKGNLQNFVEKIILHERNMGKGGFAAIKCIMKYNIFR